MPFPYWLVPACAVLLGALWGSFLNVVIVRLPRGESIVFPPSHCTVCGAKIKPWDNVPVLSFLWLRGRCRACGARFSARYPAVEALSAYAAWGCASVFGLSWAALGFYVFLALGIAIAFIDLEHWIIPHELSWPGIATGLLFSPLNPRVRPLEALLGAALAWAGFTLLSWLGEKIFKKEALGLGDRWLLALICAFLGYQAILPVVFLASMQGSLVGLALIAIGKSQTGERPAAEPDRGGGGAAEPQGGIPGGPPEPQGSGKAAVAPGPDDDWVPPKHAVPFGPFLVLAGAEVLFAGPAMVRWYVRFVQRLVAG